MVDGVQTPCSGSWGVVGCGGTSFDIQSAISKRSFVPELHLKRKIKNGTR